MPLKKERYPDNWKHLSLYVRYTVAKGRCQFCGRENGSLIVGKLSRIVLTVAHLDHDEQNNNLNNLRALCQRCHLKHDRKDNLIRRLTGRATKIETPK